MSGGWPSQAGKRAGWCGPEPFFLGRLHGPPFYAPILHGGCLDGLGAAGPDFKRKKSAAGCHSISREGWKPEGPRPESRSRDPEGSARDSPAGKPDALLFDFIRYG